MTSKNAPIHQKIILFVIEEEGVDEKVYVIGLVESMKNIWNKLKNAKEGQIYVGAFLLATIMMVLILWGNEIYPGSKRTLLTVDMRAQFVSYLGSLRYLGKGDNTIFFNWSRSLGGNFLGLFAYYLASPLSWLTLFFDIQHMTTAIYVLTVLKIGLCGLTFSIFLNRGVATKPNHPAIMLFSCCYALMAYNMVYSSCIMWLDGIILLPLVLLGVERIVQGKKGALFLVSMTSCFLFNYYISYMVGVFAAIYLLYRLFCEKLFKNRKDTLHILFRFGANTLLGIGMSAVLLVPAFLDLQTGRMADMKKERESIFNFFFFRMFPKLLPSQYDSIHNRGLPNIYCGTVIIVLVLLYFVQKNHTIREKIGSGAILILFMLSFWLVPLDIAWHGFRTPNWLPYRYSFLFSAMLIMLAYRAFEQIDVTKVQIGKLLYRMICIFTLVDLFFDGSNLIGAIDIDCYYSLQFEYEDIVMPTLELKRQVQEMDKGLYRMDKDYSLGLNDSMLLNYNSLTHSSSTYNYMVCEFIDHMGMARESWWNMNYGSTLLTDSLFGMKYRFAEAPLSEDWNKLTQESWYTLYENPYALPIAYMVDETCAEEETDWQENPFDNQDLWLQQLSGTDVECFYPVEYERIDGEDALTVTFTAPSDLPIYVRIYGKQKEMSIKEQREWDEYLKSVGLYEAAKIKAERKSQLYVNDTNYGNYFASENRCNLCIGTFAQGEKVTITLEHHGLYDLGEVFLAQFDSNALKPVLTDLAKGGIDITEHKNGGFIGTVNAKENQVLFTTVPYDRGFTVKVDGCKVPYSAFKDTFLMIPVSAGEHTIEVSYISPGFLVGGLITLGSCILTVIFYKVLRRRERQSSII